MRILIWDFDGVIVDSVKECYLITLAAIEREKARIAREAGIIDFFPISLHDFEIYRSKSVNAMDFFANYVLHQKHTELTPGNLETIVEQHLPFLKHMDGVYDEERIKLMEKDPVAYCKSVSLYPKIPETLELLSKNGIHHAIMSARDKHSLVPILESSGLQKYFELILGSEISKANRDVKSLQIRLLSERFSKPSSSGHEYYFLDDFPFNLKKLMGFAHLLFAEWGYGKLDDKYVAAQRVKQPLDLIKIFK